MVGEQGRGRWGAVANFMALHGRVEVGVVTDAPRCGRVDPPLAETLLGEGGDEGLSVLVR